nr:hypothetical protein [Propionicimonas sp.]
MNTAQFRSEPDMVIVRFKCSLDATAAGLTHPQLTHHQGEREVARAGVLREPARIKNGLSRVGHLEPIVIQLDSDQRGVGLEVLVSDGIGEEFTQCDLVVHRHTHPMSGVDPLIDGDSGIDQLQQWPELQCVAALGENIAAGGCTSGSGVLDETETPTRQGGKVGHPVSQQSGSETRDAERPAFVSEDAIRGQRMTPLRRLARGACA